MEQDGFIKRVTEPTDWVSSMAVAQKKEKIRICLDPSNLNRAIKRSIYPMKTVEQVMSEMKGAKVFSVLDAKSGYCQLPLDEESSYLTTFNSPVGRFRWLRLPFGIKSAPEIYQRVMDTMLEKIEGANAIMDDIIIGGKNTEDHDKILKEVLRKATEWNLRLNLQKCKLRQTSVKYVGHILTDQGVKPDPEKVKAITEMPVPKNIDDVSRFLGFITYLGKFIPRLSEVDQPLRAVKNSSEFYWNKPQSQAFKQLKELCDEACTLAYYDVTKPTVIQCDASSFGLGAALVQEDRVIAYLSRALNSTEQNYSQIQKELKAIEYACTKFHTYIYAKPVTIETDHKPLESIFKKPIHQTPRRLQTMLLRLSIYDLKVQYRKGTSMQLADTLSRAPIPETVETETEEETIMVHKVTMSEERQKQFQHCTTKELSHLVETILSGWPESKTQLLEDTKPYWNFREQLDVIDGLVYKEQKLVIPPSMRNYALECIHTSHMGIVKCKLRARESCYWPGMNQQIEQMIQNCQECQENCRKQQKQPMTTREIPKRPWSHCASDIFEFKGEHYAVVIDYFSKWIAVESLLSETTSSLTAALGNVFTTHGFPDQLTSDNGPQYSSTEFKQFCLKHNVKHVTTSPHYPQANGEAERAVGIIKTMWRKTTNPQQRKQSILEYNTTPIIGLEMAPSQILMGRRLKSSLIMDSGLLKPRAYSTELVRHQLTKMQLKTKENYDKCAKKRSLEELSTGEAVLYRTPNNLKNNKWQPAKVVSTHATPQSYIIDTGKGKLRRNRVHLRQCPPSFQPQQTVEVTESSPTRTTKPMSTEASEDDNHTTTLSRERKARCPPEDSPSRRSPPEESPSQTTRTGRRVVMPAKFKDFQL